MFGYGIDLTRDQEKVLIGIALILGGGMALLAFADLDLPFSDDTDSPERTEDISYASSGDDTVRESDDEASAVFSIESYGVDPYRRNIELGESVAFENNRDDRVKITFDRSSREIVLEAGERSVLQVTGITYADLESSSGWTGSAQIYVD